MDIAMPKLSGLEATRRLRQEAPHVRVIILSMHANEEYVRVALHAGAVGYLLKDSDLKELEIAIRAVARGESYLSPPVSQQPIADYMTKTTDTMNPLQRLTSRQREVLQLIAEGHTTKEIAYLLKVSVKTIETHRKELMERLNIRDLPGLVRFAIRSGLVSPDQ
jgi:DNA-binding NarL/FixJ family response regulator